MSYYDEDYYYEPSEFDQQVEEFKQSLMTAVKDEHKAEIDRLRKENAELQGVKENFEKIKADYETKKRQLEIDRRGMEQKVRGERLSSLMKDIEIVMYKAGYDYVRGPKCDKCDANRYIQFTSPSGKPMQEPCSCATRKTVFIPSSMILKEFRIDQYHGNKLIAWYSQYRDEGDGFTLNDSTVVKKIYDETMNFADLNRYDTFFRNKEDCEKVLRLVERKRNRSGGRMKDPIDDYDLYDQNFAEWWRKGLESFGMDTSVVDEWERDQAEAA